MGPADYHLAVIGGGSGGFGAALAASRHGLRVLLVEPSPIPGGTSTRGGVNTWEPGVCGPGFHTELYQRLARQPSAIGISRTVQYYGRETPWGWSRIDRSLTYRETLRRSGLVREQWSRVTFEPEPMAAAMADMLVETGHVDVRLGSRFVDAQTDGRRVTRLTIEAAGEPFHVEPAFVIDATAQLHVATAVGCRTYLGAEPRSMYEEPGAPEAHVDELNGATLCYRVTPSDTPSVEPLPSGVRDEPFVRSTSINEYPCGDLNMNPLPLMDGMEHHRFGPEAARRECEARVRRHWHWLQQEHGFDRYRLVGLFPMTGVREGPRLAARRVLTECDLRQGRAGRGVDRWIALADHALDTHGRGGGCREFDEPYGVAYECLLPQEYDNLAVACRGAGFSHIAASSCRLSRTMMDLGHAAGLAVALACLRHTDLGDVDVAQVRDQLTDANVALDPDDARLRQP